LKVEINKMGYFESDQMPFGFNNSPIRCEKLFKPSKRTKEAGLGVSSPKIKIIKIKK
jgi:hypothetical protein